MKKNILYAASIALLYFAMASCNSQKKPPVAENAEANSSQTRNVEEEIIEDEPAVVYGIDLGLSVNWAECNVGADAPQEAGVRVPYGNTNGTRLYDYDVPANICGTIYDIAVKKMGDGWRMPTEREMVELLENCTMTTDEVDGVMGVRLTGQTGNSIFLPATGEGYNPDWDEDEPCTTIQNQGVTGAYWTGTESSAQREGLENLKKQGFEVVEKANPVYMLFDTQKEQRQLQTSDGKRWCYSVRAVHEK